MDQRCGADHCFATSISQASIAEDDIPEPQEEPKAAEPVVVKYLHNQNSQEVWQASWGGLFAAFEEANSGIKLEILESTGGLANLATKATALFAAGDTVDMYYGHFTYISQFAQAEMIQSLEPFLATGGDVSKADLDPNAVEKIGGQIHGIAWFNQAKEFWYHANMLADAGLTSPRELEARGEWTWEAQREIATSLTKKEGGKVTRWGMQQHFHSTGWYINNLFAWGADWYTNDISAPTINTQEFGDATQFAVEMVTVYEAAHRSRKAREGDAGANFVRETAATRVSSGSMVRAIKGAAAAKTDPFDIEMTLLPKGPGGQRATVHSINANYISTSSLEPDATWEFYKFLIGPNSDSFIADLGGRRYTAIRGQQPIVQYDYEDAAVYEAMTALSVPTKQIIKQSEVDGAWRENWGAFEEGSKTVREVQEEMQALAEIAIEDGCIC